MCRPAQSTTMQQSIDSRLMPAKDTADSIAYKGLSSRRNIQMNIDIEKCDKSLDNSNVSEVKYSEGVLTQFTQMTFLGSFNASDN